MSFTLNEVGMVHHTEESFYIEVAPQYRSALLELNGFSHIQVIWWFDKCDNTACRMKLVENKPYKKGPDSIGIYATRSPQRPNPIAVTPAYITYIDMDSCIIGLAWIDAADGSPVLDIKPYLPCADKVESVTTPKWCAHWPKDVESSGEFDWENEFNF